MLSASTETSSCEREPPIYACMRRCAGEQCMLRGSPPQAAGHLGSWALEYNTRMKTRSDQWVKALRCLADPSRLRLLEALLDGPRDVGALAEHAGLKEYNASRHLAALKAAGLVERKVVGQKRIYALSRACEVAVRRKSRNLDLGCCVFRFGPPPPARTSAKR